MSSICCRAPFESSAAPSVRPDSLSECRRRRYCRSSLEIESDVENADAMGEPADRDQVDAGRGDLWRCSGGDAARGFGYRPTCDHRNCFCQRSQVHIVEKHCVEAVIERLAQLIERIDFEFDLDQMADAISRSLQRLGYAAGARDMIIFDQHGV